MAERVAEILGRAALFVRSETSASRARQIAINHGVHQLLVSNDGRLIGTVCRCDLDFAFDGEVVAHFVRPAPEVVRAQDALDTAAALMLEHGLGCLPVTNRDGELCGLLTRPRLQELGALPAERGIDCCASCGANDCSLAAVRPGTPVFCRSCTDPVPDDVMGELYYTLGGGD